MGSVSATTVVAPSSTAVPSSIVYTQTRTIDVAPDFLREKRIISGAEHNAFTDAYRILRTQVQQRLKEKGWNSIAITSPGNSEGKTLTAINLAISLAMEVKYTVLLVDADLRHPSIHSFFGLETEYGLSEYLTDNKPLAELLIHPSNLPRFVILPGGRSLNNSSEMLNSPKMVHLVEELKTRYPSRIVIFDLPPILSAADALVFSPYIDSAVLVIEEGKTQREDVRQAIDLLQGTNLIGTVLNKSLVSIRDKESKPIEWLNHLIVAMSTYYQPLKRWFGRIRRGKD